MCIAVYIPEKKNLTDQQIKNCFANNPDGAGIMWQENGKVHIQKGFFKVEELIKAFREIPITVPRGLHCRIATSGKISTECCHPFPIIKDIKSMGRAECIVDSAVIHNGVISFCTPHEGLLSPFSDTMVFARDFLYPMGNKINTQAFKILFEQSNTSKLLIFNKDKIIRMGTWIEDGGVYFSNTGYKDIWKMVTTYYNRTPIYSSSSYTDTGILNNPCDVPLDDTYPYFDEDIEVKHLFFYRTIIGEYTYDKAYNDLDKICNELDDDFCIPEIEGAYETLSVMSNKNGDSFVSFTIEVLREPTNHESIAGYSWCRTLIKNGKVIDNSKEK